MNEKGKDICRSLKAIRKQVAEANGIDYAPQPCHHVGDCSGTCPACEAEVRYIESQLGTLRMAGKAVKVAGLALGLTMATGYTQTVVARTAVTEPSLATSGNANASNVATKTRAFAAQAKKKAAKGRKPKVARQQNAKPKAAETACTADTAIVNVDDTCGHDLPEIDVTAAIPVFRRMYTGSIRGTDRLVRNPQHIYRDPKIVPEYKKGNDAMNKFIKDNVRITPVMAERCIRGNVLVECIVEANGTLTDVHVVRSIDSLYDAEALRVVKMMPRWKPARVEGKRVRSPKVITVPFSVE